MTAVNTDTYDAQVKGKMALSQGVAFAPVKVVSGSYTAASTASGTVINLCELPKGAVIHDVVVDTAALGASTTVKVGDGADDDRFVAASSTSSAATLRGGVAAKGYRIGTNANDNLLTATIGGAAATGKIAFTVLFA